MADRTIRRARLDRGPDGAWQVTFPFDPEANGAIRDAGARWDRQRRTWIAAPWDLAGVVAALEDLGYAVGSRPAGAASTPGVPPATAFLRSLPAHLREPAYKALVRVLHPDAGGDTAAMQELNRARSAA